MTSGEQALLIVAIILFFIGAIYGTFERAFVLVLGLLGLGFATLSFYFLYSHPVR